MELLSPSLEQLIKEIVAVNHAWKVAKDLFQENSGLAQSLRELKTRLQVRLLRCYSPNFVYLIEHQNTENDEPLYSLQLVSPIEGFKDAAHLPIRVAQEVLSSTEIQKFSNN
ncbi:hypothetical protein [Crocosphaera sp. XPORK-15E]|uniref:hypothetical protein n=1 Tax=Crocosphaera sp. XPORK-15E TaxID=3110247 RepID=UPI002B1F40F1|nr:hypothetical protein [Crocosphaera sp. XPORK-15E]MEA5535980.1 hypothetical protein [Crocosphaera sp. XPORK-15E]